MVDGKEFKGYKKRFLSQGNIFEEEEKDEKEYSNNESENDDNENIFKESQDKVDNPLP